MAAGARRGGGPAPRQPGARMQQARAAPRRTPRRSARQGARVSCGLARMLVSASDESPPAARRAPRLFRTPPPVPVKVIAGFKRIKALTRDADAVAAALRASADLVVDEGGRRVRRAAPLGEIDCAALTRRIVVAEHLGDGPTIGARAAARGGRGTAGAPQGRDVPWCTRVESSARYAQGAALRRSARFRPTASQTFGRLALQGAARPNDHPHPPSLCPPESVAAAFQKYGKVELVRVCSKNQSQKLPAWLAAAVNSLTCADAVFALVEFETEEEAAKAVEGYKNPDNWWAAVFKRV